MAKPIFMVGITLIALVALGACHGIVETRGQGGTTSSVSGRAGSGGDEGVGGLDGDEPPACMLCSDLLGYPLTNASWDTSLSAYDFCTPESADAYASLDECACLTSSGDMPPGCGDSCGNDFCKGTSPAPECTTCVAARCMSALAGCEQG
jgi:hypothetical protein